MLVLTRKVDESIIIGDNIKITVVDIRGDQAKIGIEAPQEISVHREEVYLEMQGGGTAGQQCLLKRLI